MPVTYSGVLGELQSFLSDPTKTIVARAAKNSIPINKDTLVLADLVECDFPGYEAIEITDPEFLDFADEDYGEAKSGPLIFKRTVAGVAQAITAIYLTLKEGANPEGLLWGVVLKRPATLVNADDEFLYEFTWQAAMNPT